MLNFNFKKEELERGISERGKNTEVSAPASDILVARGRKTEALCRGRANNQSQVDGNLIWEAGETD